MLDILCEYLWNISWDGSCKLRNLFEIHQKKIKQKINKIGITNIQAIER